MSVPTATSMPTGEVLLDLGLVTLDPGHLTRVTRTTLSLGQAHGLCAALIDALADSEAVLVRRSGVDDEPDRDDPSWFDDVHAAQVERTTIDLTPGHLR